MADEHSKGNFGKSTPVKMPVDRTPEHRPIQRIRAEALDKAKIATPPGPVIVPLGPGESLLLLTCDGHPIQGKIRAEEKGKYRVAPPGAPGQREEIIFSVT